MTHRWSKVDSNPRSLVSRIYAKTDIVADRETPVLVERHHLVGAPDAVEDVHVAGIRSSLGTHASSRD